MARKIMAGTILALVALAVGLTVTVQIGQRADAAPTYDGFRNIGNYAEIFSDTTNATIGDSIVFDCEKVYEWSISTLSASAIYKFKIAGRDSVTDGGYLGSVGVEHKWEVAPTWVKVQSTTGNARYTIRVQGYESGDVGRGTISDTTKVF